MADGRFNSDVFGAANGWSGRAGANRALSPSYFRIESFAGFVRWLRNNRPAFLSTPLFADISLIFAMRKTLSYLPLNNFSQENSNIKSFDYLRKFFALDKPLARPQDQSRN